MFKYWTSTLGKTGSGVKWNTYVADYPRDESGHDVTGGWVEISATDWQQGRLKDFEVFPMLKVHSYGNALP